MQDEFNDSEDLIIDNDEEEQEEDGCCGAGNGTSSFEEIVQSEDERQIIGSSKIMLPIQTGLNEKAFTPVRRFKIE